MTEGGDGGEYCETRTHPFLLLLWLLVLPAMLLPRECAPNCSS